MNYLDLLTDDLIDKILDNVTDDIDKKISLLNKKINKLNKDLKYLTIELFEGSININYENISYCIEKYLFSKFETKKDIILISIYDNYFGGEDGETYISNRIKNPTYYDILVEANKSVIITGDYHHTFLEGLNHIHNNKLLEYSGIRPNRNVEYYEFILGS